MSEANSYQIDGDHYKNMTIQPWEVMEAVLTYDEFVGVLKGNIIKYSLRQGKKEGADHDGDKALHYRAKLKEVQDKGYL